MVLTEAGFDPTIVVGGQVRILGNECPPRARATTSSPRPTSTTGRFSSSRPVVAVITNVEADHLDTYRDLADILDAFASFANRVPFYGSVVVCVGRSRRARA